MKRDLLTVLLALASVPALACNDGAGGDDAFKFLGKATASREAGEPQDQEVIEGCGGELVYAPKAVETKKQDMDDPGGGRVGPLQASSTSFKLDAIEEAWLAAPRDQRLRERLEKLTEQDLAGNWILQARAEAYKGNKTGWYSREYLLNRDGHAGSIFVISHGNPYVGEKVEHRVFASDLSYEHGNAEKHSTLERKTFGFGFVEVIEKGTVRDAREYECRLKDMDHMICKMDRVVSIAGFTGDRVVQKDQTYTAYYGLERSRPVKHK